MKAKIVKPVIYTAMDEDDNEYPILNYPESGLFTGEIVEGEVITEEKQVQYTDGSYAKGYQVFKYFKIRKNT